MRRESPRAGAPTRLRPGGARPPRLPSLHQPPEPISGHSQRFAGIDVVAGFPAGADDHPLARALLIGRRDLLIENPLSGHKAIGALGHPAERAQLVAPALEPTGRGGSGVDSRCGASFGAGCRCGGIAAVAVRGVSDTGVRAACRCVGAGPDAWGRPWQEMVNGKGDRSLCDGAKLASRRGHGCTNVRGIGFPLSGQGRAAGVISAPERPGAGFRVAAFGGVGAALSAPGHLGRLVVADRMASRRRGVIRAASAVSARWWPAWSACSIRLALWARASSSWPWRSRIHLAFVSSERSTGYLSKRRCLSRRSASATAWARSLSLIMRGSTTKRIAIQRLSLLRIVQHFQCNRAHSLQPHPPHTASLPRPLPQPRDPSTRRTSPARHPHTPKPQYSPTQPSAPPRRIQATTPPPNPPATPSQSVSTHLSALGIWFRPWRPGSLGRIDGGHRGRDLGQRPPLHFPRSEGSDPGDPAPSAESTADTEAVTLGSDRPCISPGQKVPNLGSGDIRTIATRRDRAKGDFRPS